jgi:Cu+-exporting ATPase
MISSDNAITAKAIARSVGVPSENAITGVLPHQKVLLDLYFQTYLMKFGSSLG